MRQPRIFYTDSLITYISINEVGQIIAELSSFFKPRGYIYFQELHGLTLIQAWMSNHMPGKVWDGITITYPFLNFNGATVEV